ncbi:MAG: ABC transporter permease [Mycobacteriales bacterium]|nr:MAG: ABC transporter permease [Pseudonocardiales bacterium]
MSTTLDLPTIGNRADAVVTPRRRGFWHNLWRVLRRKPTRMAGAFVVVVFVVIGIIGPWLYPANLPTDSNLILSGPSLAHPLGTDFQGADVLALLVTGTRYVLVAAALAALLTVVLGAAIGLYAGYRRGLADSSLMRITDFVLTIPGFPLLLVLSTVWKFGSALQMGLVLGITGWGGLARSVRSQTLSLRERGFVEAARGLGLSTPHVIRRELLPNIAPYVAMNLLIGVTTFIYSQVGLFYLGVLPFKAENWGVMIFLAVNNGVTQTGSGLFYLLAPLLSILLLTLAVVLLVDAMDEVFNPRLRED